MTEDQQPAGGTAVTLATITEDDVLAAWKSLDGAAPEASRGLQSGPRRPPDPEAAAAHQAYLAAEAEAFKVFQEAVHGPRCDYSDALEAAVRVPPMRRAVREAEALAAYDADPRVVEATRVLDATVKEAWTVYQAATTWPLRTTT